MRVLAIDPGLASGLSLWTVGEDTPTTFERPPMQTAELMEEVASAEDCVIVIEEFHITTRTAKLSEAPWSLELIGVARYVAHKYGVPLVTQPPSIKKFSTDQKLRMVGWWHSTPGGHANDAVRHLLAYVVKNRLVDPGKVLSNDPS